MNKLNFYKFLIAALVISHIILLSFMFFGNKKKRTFEGPKKVIIERLAFDARQTESYEKLIVEHQKTIASKSKEIRKIKNSLYAHLCADTQNVMRTDSLQAALTTVKSNIEKIHYDHFLDIKALCTPEQIPAFNKLSKDIAKLFSKEKSPLAKKSKKKKKKKKHKK